MKMAVLIVIDIRKLCQREDIYTHKYNAQIWLVSRLFLITRLAL